MSSADKDGDINTLGHVAAVTMLNDIRTGFMDSQGHVCPRRCATRPQAYLLQKARRV